MAAGPVPAVVAERHGIGEGRIRPNPAGHGDGALRHLDGVGQPGALVVGGMHDHLGLARQPPERGGVDDAVPVTFEAGAELAGLLLTFPLPRT